MDRLVQILLVEDNPADQRLTIEGLNQSKLNQKSHIVENGEEAMSYLHGEGRFAGCERPDLIILDLNLPRKDGRAVLAEIKQDPQLRQIPVVIFTTSDSDEEVSNAYDLGANCYLTKPPELDAFMTMMKGIEEFWLSLATLPSPFGRQLPA